MINIWNSFDIQIQVAIIGAFGAIIAAIIGGIFSLVKNNAKMDDKDNKPVDIPIAKPTKEKQHYNAEDYAHNAFIPSLEDLEKEDSDSKFAEGLATFLCADRSDDDISITRKGE